MSNDIESAEIPYVEKINLADRLKFRQLLPNFLIYCHNNEATDKYAVDPKQLEDIVALIQSRQDWEIEAMAADYIVGAPPEIKKIISLPWLFEKLMRYGQLHNEEYSDNHVSAKATSLKSRKPKSPALKDLPLANRTESLSSTVNKNVLAAKAKAKELKRQTEELDMDPSEFWKMLEEQARKAKN